MTFAKERRLVAKESGEGSQRESPKRGDWGRIPKRVTKERRLFPKREAKEREGGRLNSIKRRVRWREVE